jgi:hypothetical protein
LGIGRSTFSFSIDRGLKSSTIKKNSKMGKLFEIKSTIINGVTIAVRHKRTMTDPIEDDASIYSELDGDASGESIRSLTVPKHHRKSVSFGDLLIRTHPVVLGEHPACRSGCPLELGWTHDAEIIVTVDEFEMQRGRKKHPSELRTTRQERRQILSKTTSDRDLKVHERKFQRNSCNSDDLLAFFQPER